MMYFKQKLHKTIINIHHRWFSGSLKNLSKNRPKVLVSANDVSPDGLNLFKTKCDLLTVSKNEDRSEVLRLVPGVDTILWASFMRLDAGIIEAAGANLKLVATISVGYDHIDVEALRKRNIPLGHSPAIVNNAVADMTVLLALAAARRLHEARVKIESGVWVREISWLLGQDIEESTIGILGLGNIGRAVVKRFRAFEVSSIIYTDQRAIPSKNDLGVKLVNLDEFLTKSDFIISTLPLTKDTHRICNKEFFEKMKPTAVFVNIGRAQVVDQEALIEALKSGKIFAAGLDVMEPEPLPVDHELFQLPNCVLLPHLGSATVKARSKMAQVTAQNIIRGLAGEPLVAQVKY